MKFLHNKSTTQIIRTLKIFAFLLLVPIFTVIVSEAYSQNVEITSKQKSAAKIKITGTVISAKNLETLIGVTIKEKGTINNTVTNVNGEFIIQVSSPNAILEVSYMGYEKQEIIVNNNINFTIKLAESIQNLDEVVVVGYGTQKKATVTGAIESIGKAQLLQSPQANISNALVGRMPGLMSVQRSGQPGADQSVLKIRGIGTFAGSQDPLIMVDGIETSNYNDIDPNEIESIAILKDASATAVYGVRGANGVLVITTRRGKVGKPQISYSAHYATSHFTDIRHSMNAYDYANSFNLAKKYDGYITGAYAPQYSDVAIAHYKAHDDPTFYPDIDWFAYMFDKNSGQSQQNLNINGGTDKVKYFVSLGTFSQDGLVNHTDLVKDFDAQIRYKRYNIRSNFDFNVTKRFTASINLSTQIENRSGSAYGSIDNPGGIFEACWATNPVDHPVIDDKFIYLDGAFTSVNPLGYLFSSGYRKNYRNYLNSSVRFNHEFDFITKGLSGHATISYNSFNEQGTTYSKAFVTYRAKRLADNSIVYVPLQDPTPFGFAQSFAKTRKVYMEAGLDYARKFGSNNISGMLLYNQSKLFDPNLLFMVPNGYQGIVGRLAYDYKNRYLAEVNAGYNGTENFAPGKRFGLFPAYSLGWVASDEPFFPKNNYLTYLKFRGSYGEVGNDKIGGNRFLYLPASYSYANNNYQFGEDGSNQQGYQGSVEGVLGNQNLTWERAKKTNVGIELYLLNNKLKCTFDYFNENRDNILANMNTIPYVVGAVLPPYNLGKMKNSGNESSFAFNDNLGKFNYWLKANFSYAHNVIQFQDEVKQAYAYQNRTGQRFGQFFGLVADGLFNSWEEVNDVNRPVYTWQNNKIQPGDIKYSDINGDGLINSDDVVPIGYSDFPEKIFGFSFGGDYKGFDFSVLFQGASNVSVSYSRRYIMGFIEGSNCADYLAESWSQERYDAGMKINYPHLAQGSSYNTNNYQSSVPSSFWTRDASYLRLKNAEIGYTLPDKLLKKVGITYTRIFLNGSNLLTWSNMLPGADPESTAASIVNSDPYPVTRTINLGINVKF